MARTPEYRRFLQRLRKAREAAGLTQSDVARAIGRAQSYISKCESGERRVDVIELKELADVYGKSVDDFLP